ncbi:ParB N-terminal domain-containing protein [Oculatella sp. LEGE 06141]|uniref:ParB N-terminal domain-containing protein n=1 Tax=Oculatella sp. LEGE 06141 TaxID=1828648 RepID=UPI0018824657|nr:ParB N-terminal domain-containing protein [Oculatella sp. LEGE 06141]MBE9182815.1 ParB N-terminal domain-containing protein [Oculatella sp. LEGE 06141]
MDYIKRQQHIAQRLIPKSIDNGQLDTFLIAVPLSESNVDPARLALLKESIKSQGSNLLTLVVRRTDAYEEEEYEVVYGADWLIAAKELDIEKVWVWVFDLDDEQAAVTKAALGQLIGSTSSPTIPDSVDVATETALHHLLDQKLESINVNLNKLASATGNTTSAGGAKGLVTDRLEAIDSRLDSLAAIVERLAGSIEELKPKKIDLTQASLDDIDDALMEAGVSANYRKAALKAIEHWKAPGKTLTWSNLKQSTRKGNSESIANFGDGTYTKLKRVGFIP